jgi:hypothetical protein
VSEEIWLVSFMDYALGYFEHQTCRLEPIENPFGPKLLRPLLGSEPSCGASEAARERAPHSAVASERLRG